MIFAGGKNDGFLPGSRGAGYRERKDLEDGDTAGFVPITNLQGELRRDEASSPH